MEIIKAIVLGIVQGLTEFLPVSSSGHLEIAKFILGENKIGEESLLMTVILHFGTALATVYVFRDKIWNIISTALSKEGEESRKFTLKIIISMIPAVVVGLFFEKQIEALFTQNILIVCSMLLVTAALLFFADKAISKNNPLDNKNALIVGIAQAIAIAPGISRSGATICTSLLLGVDRKEAAEFSFLMVIPLIFGKMAKDVFSGDISFSNDQMLPLFAGFLAAFFVGILACTWMIQIVRKSQLKYFAWYCVVIGVIGIVYASF